MEFLFLFAGICSAYLVLNDFLPWYEERRWTRRLEHERWLRDRVL